MFKIKDSDSTISDKVNICLFNSKINAIYLMSLLCSIIGSMTSDSLREKGIVTNTAFTIIVIELSLIGICSTLMILKEYFSCMKNNINTD